MSMSCIPYHPSMIYVYIYIPTFGWFLIVNVGKYTIVPWILWVCASFKSIDVWVFGKMWKIYQMKENSTLCIFLLAVFIY